MSTDISNDSHEEHREPRVLRSITVNRGLIPESWCFWRRKHTDETVAKRFPPA